MIKAKVQFIGAKELGGKLAGIPDRVERDGLIKGIKAGANIILAEAKARVPVLTGALKRGLRIKMLTKKRNTIAALIGADRQSGGPHSHLVEFGTAPHMITQTVMVNGRELQRTVLHPGSKAQPFLFPAFESKREEAVEAVRREVLASIERG